MIVNIFGIIHKSFITHFEENGSTEFWKKQYRMQSCVQISAIGLEK